MSKITKKQLRDFADSLYNMLMISPETGEPLGIYNVGSIEGHEELLIGIGDKDGKEFWILKVAIEESSEFEVKSLK